MRLVAGVSRQTIPQCIRETGPRFVRETSNAQVPRVTGSSDIIRSCAGARCAGHGRFCFRLRETAGEGRGGGRAPRTKQRRKFATRGFHLVGAECPMSLPLASWTEKRCETVGETLVSSKCDLYTQVTPEKIIPCRRRKFVSRLHCFPGANNHNIELGVGAAHDN